MPIARTNAENSSETAQPDYLQLLLGCSVLALLLCVPIIAYTNQLKQAAAAMLLPDRSTQVSVVATIPPSPTDGPAALLGAAPTALPKTTRVFFDAMQNPSAAKAAPIRKSARHYQGGNELASPKAGFSEQIVRQQIPTRPTSGRSWSRNDFPRHAKAALIAIWRQTLKRPHAKKNQPGSLLTHPDK
jgi:hypothetical protein